RAPLPGGGDGARDEFGRIDVGVGPGGLGVQPDLVAALRTPGALVHGDEAGAGIAFEVGGATDELDNGFLGAFMEISGRGLEPLGAFKPPVAEEFGIERGAENGR